MLRKVWNAFAGLVKKCIQVHVKTQPCAAVMKDKTTINHRTVDITAISMLDPSASDGNMIQSVVAGAPVANDDDGNSIAREIKTTLASVGITESEKTASQAVHG